MTRLCFIDTETTSLDSRNGEVWEIGIIVRDPGKDDLEYLWQVQPNLEDADPNSLLINRYYERCLIGQASPGGLAAIVASEEVDEPISAGTIAGTIARMVNGAHIIGAVPDFDVRFLQKFLTDYNHCWTGHYHLIDIETMTVGYIYGLIAQAGDDTDRDLEKLLCDLVSTKPWKYSHLLKAFGVHTDPDAVHTALGDVRQVRDLYDKIVYGKLNLNRGTALAA